MDDATSALMNDILYELARAQTRFPESRLTMIALTEEVGELAKAVMDEPEFRVRAEAIQVAAMAKRIVLGGDQSVDEIRRERLLDRIGPVRK